ncbi:hypothetical protein [Embleya scabrispora]|uniref:hypothetical protein n=1 Tax=Embleya scabrispora TaxID=159449 RepID=UPI00131A2A3F|nr:hypothetical protein [Embleya scabrispora]MYS87772.1 hypothetical protein [Streptomyces sp. SID5474]
MSAPISARMICAVADSGDGVQLLGQGAGVYAAGGRFCSRALVWGGDLFQCVGDEPVEFPDLRGGMVDGAEQYSQQPGVVLVELPGQGLDEGWLLLDHAALRKVGEGAGCARRRPSRRA